MMGFLDADWLTKTVALGPPVLLVAGLLFILQAAVRNTIDLTKTAVLSTIVATFFGIWMVYLPDLRPRHIEIVTPLSPKLLAANYSLQPVQYRVEPLEEKDVDLDSFGFQYPDNAATVKMRFNLEGLIASYEENLRAVIEVARDNPKCFQRAINGNSYAKVAASIRRTCAQTLLSDGPVAADVVEATLR